MKRRAAARACVVVLLAMLAASCTRTLVDYEARTHVVQRGETLYTIAWRHGLDYRAIAQWNRLPNPDLIYVGQRLRLTSPTAPAATPVRSSVPASVPASASVPRTGGASAPRSSGTSSSRSSGTAAASRPAPMPDPPSLPAPAWAWPTQGPVVTPYGAVTAIRSGIGIGGREGQAVYAAAAGRVVYAGSGLIGYGQLVIIKHNDTYLSAYGHNSRVLVAQGQDVRRGDKIAEMGLGPERTPRLHFEIRRNGAPVDPMPYLNAAR